MFPRETFFFGARVSVCKTVGGCFFLFATDLAMEMGVTDGRVPSVRPSVIISLTEFIPVTDGISPSVKLFNGVVFIDEIVSE
jgi:hypothetical protein